MNIKLQTNEQLSATVANGLAGVFVNGVSLSASLSSAGGKVYFDNRISGLTGSDDLSVVRLSAAEYAQMLDGGTCLSNAIYIVEAPNIDAFKQQIKNVATPTDLSDAATKEYVDNALTNVQIDYDSAARKIVLSAGSSTTSVDCNDFIKDGMLSTVELQDKQLVFNFNTDAGMQPISIALSNFIDEAQYWKKSETSSANEISTALSTKSAVSFNRITTSGTNIGSITIDGTTTQIYAPTGGSGGGSSVQVSADYQTGTRVATISVDNVPTSIYIPNSGGSSGYALETAQLVADNGSLTCAVNDQTITTIQVSSSSTPVVVQLPAQPEDGARDFILRIEISSSSAPTFTFSGVNETIDFDSEDDDWAVMEPGLNLVSFTETKRGN